jgi:hypothetical protein
MPYDRQSGLSAASLKLAPLVTRRLLSSLAPTSQNCATRLTLLFA